ncbi:MAG: type IV toxin-antitoxin system AbiEi family antitoxin domain-containing protein, partial [Ilumatobacteraceae bacterium]
MFDAEAMRAAARQHGVVTRRQLVEEHGWSTASVARARRQGMLVELAPGILRVASHQLTFATRCVAAVLSSADHGFLSAGTAGHLYGLRRMPTTRIHLTVPHTFRAAVPAFV